MIKDTLCFSIVFVAVLAASPLTGCALAAPAPDIQHVNGSRAPYSTANVEFYEEGEHKWTIPEGVNQVKISSVGAGGSSGGRFEAGPGNNNKSYAFGGGGGDVVENITIDVVPGENMTIVVGSASSNSDGGDSYIIYNEQSYAVAPGGKMAKDYGSGNSGGIGGGSGGYAWYYSISNVMLSDGQNGKYGTGGKSLLYTSGSATYVAGGGGSWGDGSSRYSGGIGAGAAARISRRSNGTSVSAPSTGAGNGGAVFIAYATISLSDSNIVLAINDTYQLTASISEYDSTKRDCIWTSSNAEIASVNSDGMVTAIRSGTIIITATTPDGCFSDTCVVTVTDGKQDSTLRIIPEYGIPHIATALVNIDEIFLSYPGVKVDNGGILVFRHPLPQERFKIGAKVINSLINGLEAELTASDFTSSPLYLAVGDLNSDNIIDGSDWAMIVHAINFPLDTTDDLTSTGDLNCDGVVNTLDLLIFNSPITFSGENRYLTRGYDMSYHAADVISAMKTNNSNTNDSIISIDSVQSSPGKYYIVLSDQTPAINMFQISMTCDAPDNLHINVPEEWEVIGEKLTDTTVTFAIGNTENGGLNIPDGQIASVCASSFPQINYSGKSQSKMELITQNGIQVLPIDSSTSVNSDQASTDAPPLKTSGSGCNAGYATPTLLALVPFIIKKNIKDRGRNHK